MQHLDTFWKVINAASTVRDLAIDSRQYQFIVAPPVTFYLDAEMAAVRVVRWQLPKVEVQMELQAGFGWRVETDQDDVGVYIVAKRRPVVGNLARADFAVFIPEDTHLVLKLAESALLLNNLTGTYEIPPSETHDLLTLEPGEPVNHNE